MKTTEKLGRFENCPNCGAPCTVSGIGYDYVDSAPDLLKENQELKERIELLDEELWVDIRKLRGERDELKALNQELIEALEEITETFKSCLGGSDPLYYEDFKDEIEKAQSVLNKARG